VEAVEILEADMVRAKPLCSPFFNFWYKSTGKRNNKEEKTESLWPVPLTEHGVLSQALADFPGN